MQTDPVDQVGLPSSNDRMILGPEILCSGAYGFLALFLLVNPAYWEFHSYLTPIYRYLLPLSLLAIYFCRRKWSAVVLVFYVFLMCAVVASATAFTQSQFPGMEAFDYRWINNPIMDTYLAIAWLSCVALICMMFDRTLPQGFFCGAKEFIYKLALALGILMLIKLMLAKLMAAAGAVYEGWIGSMEWYEGDFSQFTPMLEMSLLLSLCLILIKSPLRKDGWRLLFLFLSLHLLIIGYFTYFPCGYDLYKAYSDICPAVLYLGNMARDAHYQHYLLVAGEAILFLLIWIGYGVRWCIVKK